MENEKFDSHTKPQTMNSIGPDESRQRIDL